MAGIRTENKIYEVGIYCRLSKDDGTDNESASIATQKSILTDYVKRQGWHLAKTYVDDGYSGTNFQRPSFQNMIKDIENGLINCVITKDLSRLGRNYLDCGLYLEVFFPEHNVRYIAVNDGVDTLNKVKIFRYVTEGTFDSYSWQLIENKQKFIGQIMTSKSPVRSCEDVDEAALSYAEVKALATGNPYIKEKMDLDIQVSKLKLMKANHTSQKYRLEDNITQHYPHQIAIFKERIEGFTADMEKYAKNKPEDKEQFFMQVGGKPYTDKKEAGTAIIAMCKEIKGINASADVGEYLGFKLNVTFDSFNNKFVMNVKGAMSHPMEVGTDPLGNITRINNALEAMPIQLEEAQTKLSNVEHQLETAKAEVDKPFPQEAELSEKLERLAELNALLNMDEKGDDAIGMDDEATEPEKPHEDVKKVDNREEVVADMPIKQSNLEKAAPEGERRLADRPAERTSLQEKLAAMKARVSGTPAGRDAVDKAKGKDQIL